MSSGDFHSRFPCDKTFVGEQQSRSPGSDRGRDINPIRVLNDISYVHFSSDLPFFIRSPHLQRQDFSTLLNPHFCQEIVVKDDTNGSSLQL